MSLPPSTRLGSYEIVALIGAGGMGEVYRAHDPRLGRDVAVKVLPVAFAEDRDRLRRFEQETQAAGRLNHPNILVVHDVGTENGTPFLVSELLEGDTLRKRMTDGRVPVPVALDFALQIARGLQAAHDKGIVHRDLKPENLFLTHDGRIKILDFGLAKLLAPRIASDAAETATDHRTEPGMILGTAGYMAPEQIRGEDADARADIFAFGAVLHELLAGRRAFSAENKMDVMSAILQSDAPDVTTFNSAVSPALNRIVRRCLQRQPSARFQSSADLAFAIENLSTVDAAVPATPMGAPHAARGLLRSGWLIAAVLAVGLFAAGLVNWYQPSASASIFAASISPEGNALFESTVVSPDGRSLAYTSTGIGKRRLWIRRLDSVPVSTVALSGTEGAVQPFWSPDGQSLGFFADNALKVVGIQGGQPRTLARALEARGGAWGHDDVIVFGSGRAGPLYRISARTGGASTPATTLDSTRQQTSHRWPHFLPDGRHFVYFARSADVGATGVYVASLGETSGTFLVNSSTDGVFGPPGFLLFVRGETLLAQPFDPVQLKMSGEPASLVPKVGFRLALNRGLFSVSNSGVLVYGASEDNQPVWFDRTHGRLSAIGSVADSSNIYLSHDGRLAAIERPDAATGANDLHVIELERGGIASRFTTNPNGDSWAVWTHDDQRLIWASNRTGFYDLYTKSLSGGDEELLLQTREQKTPTDISLDGRFLLYESAQPGEKSRLMVLSLSGDKRTFPLLSTGFNEWQGRMSPDGRWISYTTDKDGSEEVYLVEAAAVLPRPGQPVAPARDSGGSGRRVSPSGGARAMWRADGKREELYFISGDRRLMAVPITETGPGLPVTLFEIGMREVADSYAPYPDGQRFLLLTRVDESAAATIVQHWAEALRRPQAK